MGLIGRLAITAALLAVFCNTASAGLDAVQGLLKKAAADPATRTTLIREGAAASFFCKNCHGDTGTSRFPDVPNLAGQNPAYIVTQIDAFLTGKRRNDFMQGLMKVLGDREKAAIALSYANAPSIASAAMPGAAAGEGEAHFKRICVRCHQADAHGNETIPRLAGQQPEYLRLSLKRYLNKTGERVFPEMSTAVAQLGEQNIEAVVQYLASLK